MAAPPYPRWLEGLNVADLARAGLDAEEADGNLSPSAVLAEWAGQYDVDLASVEACLALLASGPYLLHAGSPLALMTFSPRRQRFRASIDSDCERDLAGLSLAAAGAWLTVLSAEAGPLPAEPEDWSIVRLDSAGMCGKNQAAVDRYQRYARLVAHRPDALDQLDDYERQLCRAVWTCASYALR